MNLNWTEAARSMTKCQLGLMLALVGSTVTPSPAQADSDEKSKVIAEWLVNFTIETLPDLTTAPQRATIPNTFQWLDALAIAPAEPADWTPITKAVPGILMGLLHVHEKPEIRSPTPLRRGEAPPAEKLARRHSQHGSGFNPR